ncbi:MAG TPA: SPOR domain-containing protein [Candidatus Binatia bacterium]|nr:SPOR domain-containing protein [Candidatus Binatia bacterium]
MAKERRTGLGLLDRLVLFLAWVATCGLVYLLGLYVGKGMQERRLGLEERVVRLPVTSTPPPEGQRANAESDLTFYDTLVPGERGRASGTPAASPRAVPAAAKPAPVPAPIPVPAPARREAAAKPDAAPAKAPPTVSPPAVAHVPVSAPAPAPSAPLRSAPLATPAPPPGPSTPAARPVAAEPTPVPAPPPRAAAAPVGGWTVQANPTRSRDEAEALARELRGRGYDAVVVRLPRDGDVWYRVRIGRYTTSEQATEVMQRLREREGVSHAFVAGGE